MMMKIQLVKLLLLKTNRVNRCYNNSRFHLEDDSTSLKQLYANDFYILNDAISVENEITLVSELSKKLNIRRYERGHWDSVISHYREFEIDENEVSKEAVEVLNNCKSIVNITTNQNYDFLPIHCIDLASRGFISPHVDSVKFSGDLIATLSLLSCRILHLAPDTSSEETICKMKTLGIDTNKSFNVIVPARSIYILKGPLRYYYTHSIKETSCGEELVSKRRISLMFRNKLLLSY